ncbi:MAG: hypothetical protein Kow0062_06210 [Acidobacteriota bacterium]
MTPARRCAAVCLAVLLATPVVLAASLEIDERIAMRLEDGRRIVVDVLPERGEGWLSLATRMCGSRDAAGALAEANGGRGPYIDVPVRVPWRLLREEYRYLALRALFPRDRPGEDGWHHRPAAAALPIVDVGLWQIAEWFTGSGENWTRIAAANGLVEPIPPRDRELLVPADLLRPLFRLQRTGADGLLEYGEDEEGEFAVYRLRRGEALYSAVVLRFTDVIEGDGDGVVQSAVDVIRERSGIRDVRDIPVGYPVRIPLELLAVRYLPENHPRRVLAAIGRSEMAAIEVPRRPRTLDGIHVVLDSGHGGEDPGAMLHGAWESDYTYDVACRVKRLLERETGATVHMIVRDTETGCRIANGSRLVRNRKEVIASTPPFRIDSRARTTPAVHMRWMVANSLYGRLTGRGKVPSENVVFLSLHADSLHRSVRGAMVYVPGARYRRSKVSVRRSVLKRHKEYTPTVRFTRRQRLRDEKISTRLGEALLDGFRHEKLLVHKDRPLRTHIVRKLRRRRPPARFVPAVLAANRIPAKVLVELVNLNNREDARTLLDPNARERMARAIVRGLETFYGGE